MIGEKRICWFLIGIEEDDHYDFKIAFNSRVYFFKVRFYYLRINICCFSFYNYRITVVVIKTSLFLYL